jgi:hypothetical protein
MRVRSVHLRSARLLLAAVLAGLALAAVPSSSQAFYIDPCIIFGCPAINSGPLDGAVVSTSNVTFGYSYGVETYLFRCTFDGSADAGCSNIDIAASTVVTKSYSSLSEGSHTFAVYAQPCMPASLSCLAPDPAGPSSTRIVTFTVDRTAPVASFNSGPADLETLTGGSTSIGFAATDATAVTFSCSLDDAPPATCSSPMDLTGLAAGPHKFVVNSTDAAGNQGSPIIRVFAVAQSAAPPATTATIKKCKSVKVKRHGKFVRTKSGQIKRKKVCQMVAAA